MKSFFVLFFSVVSLFILSSCTSQNGSLTQVSATAIFVPNTPTSAVTCATVSKDPTPVPGGNSLIPAVTSTDFSIGPTDAAVTLIEYCDFQSPGCLDQAYIIGSLLENHKDLKLVFRPMALTGALDKADKAFIAAMAADKQGMFWSMYKLLFTKHKDWENLNPGEFYAWVENEAPSAGMDAAKLTAAIKAPETTTRMISTMQAINKLSLPGIPLIAINGAVAQLTDAQSLNDTIGLIALGKKQFSQCPAFIVDAAKNYIATIQTEKGDIVIQLYPDKAPLAVNSFVFLAKQGWFDNVSFHRVIPGFVAQSGDPSGTGRGNPGYFFKTEFSDLHFDTPGVVAMANSGPDTNGSQFFITFAPAPHLDGSYTIFGKVISGLDVAEQLTPRNATENPGAPPGDKILSVEVEEK